MTRTEAVAIANEVLAEHQLRPKGQVKLSEYLVALLVRLELLKVDDD